MSLKDPSKTEQMLRENIARLDQQLAQLGEQVKAVRAQRDELAGHLDVDETQEE